MVETRGSLLKRLRHSCDQENWAEFVALYEPLIFRYVRSRGLSENDAQDVVQNVFASLVQTLLNFELDHTRGRFRTWLWRVTQNAITDWARRQQRQKVAEEKWRELVEVFAPEPEPEWEATWRQRVFDFSLSQVREETNARTWACFEGHVLQGRGGSEVAEELGMKIGTVYVNASRVLERVRRRCAEYLQDLEEEPAPEKPGSG